MLSFKTSGSLPKSVPVAELGKGRYDVQIVTFAKLKNAQKMAERCTF